MRIPTLSLPGPDGLLELDAGDLQGTWTAEQYLRLAGRTNRLVELVDGRLEVLPMPSTEHQILLVWLLDALRAAAGPSALVLPAALPLRDARDRRRGSRQWTSADLAVEIVSPDDPNRDYEDKRADYAAARVPEYWLVDPAVRRFKPRQMILDTFGQLTWQEAQGESPRRSQRKLGHSAGAGGAVPSGPASSAAHRRSLSSSTSASARS